MNPNWLFIPTIGLAFILFKMGTYLEIRYFEHEKSHLNYFALLFISFIVAIPGILFTLYYLHFFDNAKWFYQFRSLPFTELSASGLGLFGGLFHNLAQRRQFISKNFTPIVLSLLFAWLMVPYLKPILYAINPDSLQEQWIQGVCLQSSSSSCGPASAATLFKAAGYSISERTLVKEAFTSSGGTEIWYLARAFQRRGFQVEYVIAATQPEKLYFPAIAGVRLSNNMGHFIAVLGENEHSYIGGDPLLGKVFLNKTNIHKYYYFTGFFLTIMPPS